MITLLVRRKLSLPTPPGFSSYFSSEYGTMSRKKALRMDLGERGRDYHDSLTPMPTNTTGQSASSPLANLIQPLTSRFNVGKSRDSASKKKHSRASESSTSTLPADSGLHL